MHTICNTRGTLEFIEDGDGKAVDSDLKWAVQAHLQYELQPSPRQPLIVNIYGQNLVWMGNSIARLVLHDGVTLTGPTHGVGNILAVDRLVMFDVREKLFGLQPAGGDQPPEELDSVVFGVVSSSPLGRGSCTTRGWSRPGRPFQFIEGALPEERVGKGLRWTAGSTLRISHREFEIWFAPTSKYWKGIVHTRSLQHESIVGIRRKDRGVFTWDDFNEIADLVTNFTGWVNHCVSPVFHLKAYRKGKLVYRGYHLYPHPTVQRDRFSWLPLFPPDDHTGRLDFMVEQAFEGFATTWEKSRNNKGLFHIALQLLRSKEKGAPGSRPSILYLRDTFGAISILTSMLVGSNPNRSRHDTMMKCIKRLSLADRIPDPKGRRYLSKGFPELWTARKGGAIQENERSKGTLSRPLANVENWLVHLENSQNAKKLLGLGTARQSYFVEASIWLADLMLLRVVGYEGYYLDRLTGKVREVPWKS